MSHQGNTKYIEDVYERFFSNESGFERCAILLELQHNGFDRIKNELVDLWRDERDQFLDDNSVEADDLLTDENGEFWFEENEMGTPGDDYQITTEKTYVPSHLEVDYWLRYKEII